MSNRHPFTMRLVLSLTALIAVGGSGGLYLVHAQKRSVAVPGKESVLASSTSTGPALLVEAVPVQTRRVPVWIRRLRWSGRRVPRSRRPMLDDRRRPR